MSTDTESIQPNVPVEKNISSAPSKVPESINKIPLQPISQFFEETTGFCNIYDKVKSDVIKILHCHGIPGSGKTQVAYNLAKKFIDKHSNDGEKVIAWPIACRESNHEVKKRLQELADELQWKKIIKKDVNYSIKDDLKNNGAVELMRALFNCNAHVLILIEDAKNESKQLLQEMCLQLQNICSRQVRSCKFHLYLTSRKKDLLFEKQTIGIYQLEPLNGFSKEEAIQFLKDLPDLPFNEVAANKICERFSCLPFGLLSAREFCRERRIDYELYLIRIQENELKLDENEKEFISRKFGQSAQHVFEAIVMPFKPNDPDYETELPWRILSCLSYFYAGCMPKFLLERCCYIINSDPKTKTADPNPNAKKELDVESCTGKLISKLVDEYSLCSETPEKDIVFHQVVLNAFRVHHQALSMDSKCLSMKMAIEVLCSLVTKNFIKEGNNKKMLKLRPHLQSLLKHAGSIDKTMTGLRGEELLLFKALLSHLSDVTATIMSGESALQNNHCGEYFEKALGLLWEDKWQDITDITVCDPSLNFKDCSKKIVKLSKSRGQIKTHKDFIVKYNSRLSYCFNESFILESASTEKSSVVKTIWKKHSSKRELMTQLQKCDIILQDQLYCKIFYAERFASILHSWSRSILDADPEEVKKDSKSAWRSSLSRNISIQCRLLCSVTLLCERLACRAKISILLEQKKPDHFEEVHRLCCETLLADLEKPTWKNQKKEILKKLTDVFKIAPKENKAAEKIFENGFPINVSGFSPLANLRDLVRLYTKVDIKSSVDEIQNGVNFCEELERLALQNKDKYSNIPSCFVYCAKYYVARKNFPKSLECFHEYFSKSSYNDPKPSFKSYCWAVYNYAKALASHPNPPSNEVKDVKRNGELILDGRCKPTDVISKDLNNKINMMLRKL